MIRPATGPECSIIRTAWARTFNPSAGRGDLVQGMLPWGRRFDEDGEEVWPRRVSPTLARRMVNALADSLATPETVIVWDVDGQPLSCLCRELVSRDGAPSFVAIHFAYTVGPARGHGLALSLLRYAQAEADATGVPMRPTHMTEAGAGLWRSVTDVPERS